jgi:hypothetical protein
MAATVDVYTSRSAFPSSPSAGTIAFLWDAISRVGTLYVFTANGWQKAAHGAFTNPGE